MYVFVFDAFWAGGLAFLDACTRKEKDIYSCNLYVVGFNLPFIPSYILFSVFTSSIRRFVMVAMAGV